MPMIVNITIKFQKPKTLITTTSIFETDISNNYKEKKNTKHTSKKNIKQLNNKYNLKKNLVILHKSNKLEKKVHYIGYFVNFVGK